MCVQLPATLLPVPPPSLPPFQNLEMIKVAEEEAQALAGTIRKKTYKGDVEIETDSQDKIEVLVIPLNYLCMYQVNYLCMYQVNYLCMYQVNYLCMYQVNCASNSA